MTGKGYFCFITLSFKGRRSTHNRNFLFRLRTGTMREQYDEQLSLIISRLNRSFIICSRSVHANFRGAYANIELSLSEIITDWSSSRFFIGLYLYNVILYVCLSTWPKSILISVREVGKSSSSIISAEITLFISFKFLKFPICWLENQS